MTYASFVTQTLDRYKCKSPSSPLVCLPILAHDGQVMAYLRPITEDYLVTIPSCVELMSRWRTENPTISTGLFKVTYERTKKWLDDYVINNDRRIIFLVMDFNGQYLGHIGLASFDYETRSAEVDSVLRGVKGVKPGLMQQCMQAIITWGRAELELNRISLSVFNDNEHAVRFYERCGFTKGKLTPLVQVQLPDEVKWEIGTEADRPTATRFYLEMVYAL